MLYYHIFEKAKACGYNKTALQKAAGLSSATVAKIGKNEPIRMDVLERICKVLRCQPGELLEYIDDEDNPLLERLREEAGMNLRGGIYHLTQVKMAYNTNRIEGSRLTEDQTRYIYETNTVGIEEEHGAVNVDDITETINHFAAFHYLLEVAEDELTEEIIKEFHRILKTNTSDSRKEWFAVGDYKKRVNLAGERVTTKPEYVAAEMAKLLADYQAQSEIREKDIIDFHYRFECIHAFQDGNGRVGRLILFKECLKHKLVPMVIEDRFKQYYYRGLKEYEREPGYLVDTCLHGQDVYRGYLELFDIAAL